MYLHPIIIDAILKQLTEQLNKACLQNRDPIEIAAWAHCRFQEIHPYDVANKRTSRTLMNLILVLHNIPAQDFITPLEIHAYSVALFHQLFYNTAAPSAKSQYQPFAFYEFLKNKIAFADQPQAWGQYLNGNYLPKYEPDIGLQKDLQNLFNDKTEKSMNELILSLQSFIQQKPPVDIKKIVPTSKAHEAGVSFFKPKVNYSQLKIVKHNPSLQKRIATLLDDVITRLNLSTITKEGTANGWRVFNTSQPDCFMAQVDCCTQQAQQALQDYLEPKDAKVVTSKSKQETYIVRFSFIAHELETLFATKLDHE